MTVLFGTDGIRGKANTYPITAEMAVITGMSVAYSVKNKKCRPTIVVGQDPRISSDMIAHGLISGICSMGADVLYAGVLPTPAIACRTALTDARAGIMISASHNPYHDNGIKVFDADGYKLTVKDEENLEDLILYHNETLLSAITDSVGRVQASPRAAAVYREFLARAVPADFSLSGIKIVMDCSNGATSGVAPDFFSDLGAIVIPLFTDPDGLNINDNCGSQHPEHVSSKVIETNADIGIAFDGDGDRLIAVDEKGNIITGDAIVAVLATHLKRRKKLINNLVVTTVMSNIGLSIALKNHGINHILADVGDRQVMEQMRRNGAVLGGEDSGHLILLDHHSTGDGMMTALKLLEVMRQEEQPLSELTRIITFYPQELINVPVKDKPVLSQDTDIQDAIHDAQQILGENGRVLVRYSGTRHVCRVMVEGPSQRKTRLCANKIADVIADKIGV